MSMILYSAFIVASMTLAAYALLFELQRSAIELARANLFDIRDRLFALGQSGRLEFASRPYRIHRSLLNGMIRYSDDISVTHMLLSRLQADRMVVDRGRRLSKEMEADAKRLPPALRKELTTIVRDAHTQMVMLMINRSVVLTVIMRVLWLMTIGKVAITELMAALLKKVRASAGHAQPAHGIVRVSGRTARPRSRQAVLAVSNGGTFQLLRSHWESRIDRNAIQLAEAC